MGFGSELCFMASSLKAQAHPTGKLRARTTVFLIIIDLIIVAWVLYSNLIFKWAYIIESLKWKIVGRKGNEW